MTFLQNLWRDLVDKRLWPVVVGLLVALVAVPLVISSGDTPAAVSSATPVGVVGGPAAEATAEIAVAAVPGGRVVNRGGKSRDPFKPLVFAKTPKTPASATATAASSPRGAAAGGVAGPGPSSASSGGTPAKPDSRPTPVPAATRPTTTTRTRLLSYAMTVAVKRSGRTTTRRGIRAITYLPSSDYPLVTFLGVKSDGVTATFLLAEGVEVLNGRTACRPSDSRCELVELKATENVLLARTPKAGAAMKRFRLTVRSIALREVQATRSAAAAHSSRSSSGGSRVTGGALPLSATELAPVRQVTRATVTG